MYLFLFFSIISCLYLFSNKCPVNFSTRDVYIFHLYLQFGITVVLIKHVLDIENLYVQNTCIIENRYYKPALSSSDFNNSFRIIVVWFHTSVNK